MTTQRREVRKLIQSYCDEYGVLFGCHKDPPFDEALADAIIALKQKRKPRTQAQEKAAELYHLARAIAEVCIIGYEENDGRMLREAKLLSKATPTPTPENVKRHYGAGGTWYYDSYIGRTFDKEPTPAQIRATWAKLVGNATASGDDVLRFDV